jgi:Acyl-CoA reductase (LuxC)
MRSNVAEHTVIRSATSDASWPVETFIEQLTSPELAPAVPFAEESTAFCASLSEALFGLPDVRSHPEIVALAYWLRPGSIELARGAFAALEDETTVLTPRGLVFHVPPGNVETIFVYSWALSLLVGNINVVRVSERESAAIDLLCSTIGDLMAEPRFEQVAGRNRFVFTGHDDAVSAALSSIADVRVVWGGDATIQHFRRFPLPVRGRELTFPDRHSFAILGAEAVATVDDATIDTLAGRFFNDAYWFDQGACASPRLVIWHDPDGRWAETARSRFHEAVTGAIADHEYQAMTGAAIAKMVRGFRSIIEQPVTTYEAPTPEATWLAIDDLTGYRRQSPGGGIFYEYVSQDLDKDLSLLLTNRDQTAAHFGIDARRIRELARSVNGRGVDRWVPVGHALDFDRVWDGYDLLQEFTKRVTIHENNERTG